MAPHNLTRREFLTASLASAATLLIAGCQPVTDGASRINPAPSATPRPRVLRINMPLNRGDIGAAADPGCSGAYHSYFINSLMFSALIALDAHLQPTPDLAASWQINDDGTVWRFRLRKDVAWSDGTPVTAHDFAWAIKRNLAPTLYCGGQYWQLVDIQGARAFYTGETADANRVGVRALDDLTLEVTLENPSAYFINLASLPSFMALPRQVVEKAGDQAWTKPANVVSNGPFRLAEWIPEKQMIFTPNPGYHGGAPGVDRLIVNMIRQESTALSAYEAGELDMVEVPVAELGRVRADATLSQELQSNAELTTMHLRLSVQIKPLADVRMRHAFALAIDRETLCNKVLPGIGQPAYQFLPPNMLGHDGQLGRELAFDPARGRALLIAAGYASGKEVPLVYWQYEQNETYQTLFEALQAMILENLGVRTELAPTEAGARQAWRAQRPLRPHFYRQLWGADYPDAHNFMTVLYTTPPPQADLWKTAPELIYSNRTFDDLVRQASRELDPVKRAALYQQCERILVLDDPAIIPLYYVMRHRLIKPALQGLIINGMGAPAFRQVRLVS
ncbi:peptide ABC transporter substrate-binding protein [Candidatus Amarolinea dominans]|uniref:peptide ABC transporter substrate-binding protein n=1 Tax=Candidatus Amarolinea dominans TaxID=3140696 RepID=UPI001DA100FE|nr:peptide ABC transporter substrate-binding protein [Anaerolineae bacterium]